MIVFSSKIITGDHKDLCMHLIVVNHHSLRVESDSLHEDVREGRLSASSAEEQRLEGEKEERNPPSNGVIINDHYLSCCIHVQCTLHCTYCITC